MEAVLTRARSRRLGALAAGGALVAAGLLAPAVSASADTTPDLSTFTDSTVYLADIQDHESAGEVVGNYDAWHIGSGLSGEQYTVSNSGILQLVSPATANGHAVQLLKGYPSDTPVRTTSATSSRTASPSRRSATTRRTSRSRSTGAPTATRTRSGAPSTR